MEERKPAEQADQLKKKAAPTNHLDLDLGTVQPERITTGLSSLGYNNDKLYYRGYDIEELAEHTSYEQVIYLLFYEDLPSAHQLQSFKADLSKRRSIPPDLKKILEIIKKDALPTDVLRTIVSAMGLFDKEKPDFSNQFECALNLIAIIGPAILYWYHFSHFGKRIDENPVKEDTISTNFLRLLTQASFVDPDYSRAFELCLIAGAENTGPSTLATRIVSSTLSDYHSSLSSAISALRGRLHGGAVEMVIRYLKELHSPSDVDQYIKKAVENKERVMGFGHIVHKTGDPRRKFLKFWADKIGQKPQGNKTIHDIANYMESKMALEKKLNPNIDFYSAVIYHQCGIPSEFFTSIFAISRTPGWSAHTFEQRKLGRVLHHRFAYNGVPARKIESPYEKL